MQIVLYCTYLGVLQTPFIIHFTIFYNSVGNDAGFWMLYMHMMTENICIMDNHIGF